MNRLILLLFGLAAMASANAATIYGDVNNDGRVDVDDVNFVLNIMLGGGDATTAADIDGDGRVDIDDLNIVLNVMLGKSDAPEPTGYDYVWQPDGLPEIHITVPLSEWNTLLGYYDANPHTRKYITASNFTFIQNGERTEIESVGLRLKGNTSRRRPEGSYGMMHNSNHTEWHHAHFGVNLRKYHKDEDHTIQGVRKLHLKWFKDDPNYCRELFCYNLFRQAGVWTAPRSGYCRLWLKVEGDASEAYFGVYEMNEYIDENYLKERDDENTFGTHKGNLWKCKYVNQPASLSQAEGGDYWWDDDNDDIHTYTLHTNTSRFENARAQLIDFQLKLNGKGRESFYTWINQVCDVDLLLKTLAVNVALGMWDDYWNNSNNYYLYFTTEDIYDYKVYLIPYDYDNTLGTSNNCGNLSDSGRQNPLAWGQQSNRLIQRLMDYDDFRAKYVQYLKEVVDDANDLMYYTDAIARINGWHARIANYVSNDTGEDMTIYDYPASWGNHPEYRLLQTGSNNFFQVKASVINALP